MLTEIKVSAPGKLMLLGEHAVVYDRPCLVTAVDQRLTLLAQITTTPTFELEAPDVSITGYKKPLDQLGQGEVPKGARFLETALANFNRKHSLQNGIRVSTSSEFSPLFGFGSSSASTVCILKALSELNDLNLSERDIFDLAFQTVIEVQGTGSGFDVAAATYGGTLYYSKAGTKTIEPLSIPSLPLLIGYSGIKADTVTVVKEVADRAKKYPHLIENIYDQIGTLIDPARKALEDNDLLTFGELMNFNQGLLVSLGVSSRKLEDMIFAAKDAGAYGAKLSGAGVGDCMIAIAPEQKETVVCEGITQAGGTIVMVAANAEGVRVEHA